MQDTHGQFIHPEVFCEVLAEFKRLHGKHPNENGQVKWAMARDLVWTLALADTAIIKSWLGLRYHV